MEKIFTEKTVELEKTLSIIDENERIIANILHDVKSPLYSIKFALENNLENQLNKDIFNTTVNTLEYIENFLVNYSFSKGNLETKTGMLNIKQLINNLIENYKYIFIDRKIHIDFILNTEDFIVNSNQVLLTSVLANIISNIAFHAKGETSAIIELYKKGNTTHIDFKNLFNKTTKNTSLGLSFAQKFANTIHAELKLKRTKDTMSVNLKIPNLK